LVLKAIKDSKNDPTNYNMKFLEEEDKQIKEKKADFERKLESELEYFEKKYGYVYNLCCNIIIEFMKTVKSDELKILNGL
jgi:hypothetical protein